MNVMSNHGFWWFQLKSLKFIFTAEILLGHELLNLGQEAGIHDQEGQRVMQVRNRSTLHILTHTVMVIYCISENVS